MSWHEVKLGDLIEVKHGFAFKSKYFCDEGSHIVLTPGNCHEKGGLKLKGEKEKFYDGEFADEFLLSKGDLLVVMTDLVSTAPVLGGSFLIPEDNRFLHNQRLGLVTVSNPEALDKQFLYHLLNTHQYRGQVRGSASGATVRHTSPGRIRDCILELPESVDEQRRIASILSAYDDLIENNRRRIQLLEESARLLYKEWFVHLRFPGHEHTTITDGLPEGWERKPFSDLATFLNGFAFKPAHLGDAGMPVIKIPELRDGPSEKTPYNRGDEIATKYRVRYGDILFSWSGTLLVNHWHYEDGLLNQHLFKVTPKIQGCKSLIYLSLRHALDVFRSKTVGAVMGHIRKGELETTTALFPSAKVLSDFEDLTTPLLDQVGVLKRQNNAAAEARDLLLPRLMSGEVAV